MKLTYLIILALVLIGCTAKPDRQQIEYQASLLVNFREDCKEVGATLFDEAVMGSDYDGVYCTSREAVNVSGQPRYISFSVQEVQNIKRYLLIKKSLINKRHK